MRRTKWIAMGALLLAGACSAAPPPPPPAPALSSAPGVASETAPRSPWIELTGAADKTVLTGRDPGGRKLYEVSLGKVLAALAAPDGGAFAVVEERGPKKQTIVSVLRIDAGGREPWRTPVKQGRWAWRLFLAGDEGGPAGYRLFAIDFSGDGRKHLHVLDAESGEHLREIELDITEADARGGVVVVAGESRLTRLGPEGDPVWTAHVRRFPSLDPSAVPSPARKVAVGFDGTVLTGASDGSLLALDREGEPLYQLGVRGAVSRIEARWRAAGEARGGFVVDTGEGRVAVARGMVREVSGAAPPEGLRVVDNRKGRQADEDPTSARPAWKPTAAYRAQHEGPAAGKRFHHVKSLIAAPRDVWVLGRGEAGPDSDDPRLFHHDGQTWSDHGEPSISFPEEVFAEGKPKGPSRFIALGLARSPAGALLVLGVRSGQASRLCVLERTGSAFRERRELLATFAKLDVEYGTKLSYTASADGREVLCSSTPDVCVEFGRGVTPGVLPDDQVPVMPGAGVDFEDDGTPVGAVRSAWSSARDDVWITGVDGDVARFDGNRWWRILGVDRAGGLSVTGSGRGDVWVSGDAGLWHVTPEPDAEADLEGVPSPPPPAAAPSLPLTVTGVDSSVRLERVVLEVDGQKPLRTAIGIAEGPGGVLWLHDGARVVEYDGARARQLYQAPRPEPFYCWYAPEPDCNLCAECTERRPKPLDCQQCLAPTAAGEGAALVAEGWMQVRGGRAAAQHAPLSHLLAVAAAPSGAIWAVSAGDDDLPRAMIRGPRGVRFVTGLPPASYADVAVRAEDDVWLAGGLTTVVADGRMLPEGEGTLVRFDGRTFTRHRAPDGALLSVAAAGPGEVWAVGLGGGLIHAKGGVVEAFHLEREGGARLPVVLRGVAAAGPNDVWMVGDGSTLLRWDGKALRRVDASSAGREAALSAVIAPGAKPGWVVGPGGIWKVVKAR